jgi:hypothetical protein
MSKRSLSIFFVVVALLFSAWGNVIAAAFCPRFALNRDCCLKGGVRQAKPAEDSSSCHHEMAGMKMDDMQMEPEAAPASDTTVQDPHAQLMSETSSDAVVLDLPLEPCAHCLSHSQTTSGSVSIVAIDPSKRVGDTNSLPANFAIGVTGAFADLIVPTEHGPPGPSSPRHVMISVFRI